MMKAFLLSNLLVLSFVFATTDIFSQSGQGTLTTSGVTYNSDSSVNISRPSDKVQLTNNPISPTQGWVAVRMKMGFAAYTSLSSDPIIWDMSETDPSDLFVYYDIDTDRFRINRRKSSTGGGVYTATQSFSQGSFKTIIASWTSTQVKISIDGGTFLTANTGSNNIPSLSPFLIGSSNVQGSGRMPNSDYYWVAAGTGTLTDTDASTIHGFGNVDKKRSEFPGNAVFMWWANSDIYNNDDTATSTPTASPTPTNSPTATPTPIKGDANGDRKVDGLDYVIWLNNYGTNTNLGQSKGDFNNDQKVDGLDYVVWLNNYGTIS